MSDKGLMGHPREPDPARETDMVVIRFAIAHAEKGLTEARRMLLQLGPSDDYVRAMNAIEAARKALKPFEA